MVDQDGDDGSFAKGPRTPLGGTPRPRSRKGTLPVRLSLVRNVVTPMKSGSASRPTAREAEFFSRNGTVPEAKATRRKARGSHNLVDRALAHAERRLTGTG